ncbi:carbon storage regulator, CsrA [Neorhodopirellula lusitana]|uniref:Translational regulator CsrA n=1 Tax=Neorhodopirellula lusitana TaxID=445327 RepID=A0ABY1QHY6_9BACT|nr:carbon storage regulator [Neorhodopirellula lusitana]SMP71953.1 carbon storage regulator, CsrA [Neorhodopirellula lusitana]
MLVLSRKLGEQLVIGDDVTVTITKISGNRVTVAIDAPREVAIKRAELLEKAAPVQTRQQVQQGQGTAGSASSRVAAYHA